MAKYSFGCKKQIIMEYLNREGGTKYLVQKYGVASPKDVRKWINNYNVFGDDGLRRSQKHETYS